MKSTCFLLCVVFAAVRAQIPSFGFCPDYTPMDNFEMSSFLGKWYEAERYFTFTDIASRCALTDYAETATGKIFVSNEYTNRLTGVKRVISGTVQETGRAGEGKITVKYSTQPIATETNLVVLDTDYDSYAVVWSCSGLGPIHAENAWLLTRERLPPSQVLQRAYGVLDKFRINRTFFIKTEQEGCPIAASDINASQGITSISTVVDQTGKEQRQEPARKKPVDEKKNPEETEADEEEPAEKSTAAVKTSPVQVAEHILQASESTEDKKDEVKDAVKSIVKEAIEEAKPEQNIVKS